MIPSTNALNTILFIGTSYQKPQDCRVTGCKEGECVAYGRDYVCKQSEYKRNLKIVEIFLLYLESYSFYKARAIKNHF